VFLNFRDTTAAVLRVPVVDAPGNSFEEGIRGWNNGSNQAW